MKRIHRDATSYSAVRRCVQTAGVPAAVGTGTGTADRGDRCRGRRQLYRQRGDPLNPMAPMIALLGIGFVEQSTLRHKIKHEYEP